MNIEYCSYCETEVSETNIYPVKSGDKVYEASYCVECSVVMEGEVEIPEAEVLALEE